MMLFFGKKDAKRHHVTRISNAIHEHASRCAPKECCGVIINADATPIYIELKNVSDTPQKAFLIDPDELSEYGNISFIVHSHLGESSEPSQEDKVSCDRCGIPFLIVSEKTGEITTYSPQKSGMPLVGRRFLYSVNDCYGLVKDYFSQKHDIEIADRKRPKFGWWDDIAYEHELDYGLAEEGAYEINSADGLKVGDIIVMRVQSAVPNHIGVYVGSGAFLHHVCNGKSLIEVYGNYWEQCTVKVMRLKRMDEKCS